VAHNGRNATSPVIGEGNTGQKSGIWQHHHKWNNKNSPAPVVTGTTERVAMGGKMAETNHPPVP